MALVHYDKIPYTPYSIYLRGTILLHVEDGRHEVRHPKEGVWYRGLGNVLRKLDVSCYLSIITMVA